MTITWIFAICLLRADGTCGAYLPQSNFAYLSLAEARQRCELLLQQAPPGQPGAKPVCVKGYQYDETQGSYR